MTDASNVVVGAALSQIDEDCSPSTDFNLGSKNFHVQPVTCFAKKLPTTETRYSTFDRELLAIYLTLKLIRYVLEGFNFIIDTDHKPLVVAFRNCSENHSLRQTRHIDFILQFTLAFVISRVLKI